MTLAGLLLFVATFLLLRDRETTYRVVRAAEDIRAGTVVRSSDLETVAVKVDEDVLAGLLPVDQAAVRDGWVAATSVASGELVSRSDLREPAAPQEQRAMSFPIEALRAVGGDLQAGDRVDVIAVVGGLSSYVAADLEVIAVAAPESRAALAGGGTFGITVAVDPEQALALAEALSVGDVTVLRSTGSTAVDLPSPTPSRRD
jgi:Flp pilus assembly protein CpaB